MTVTLKEVNDLKSRANDARLKHIEARRRHEDAKREWWLARLGLEEGKSIIDVQGKGDMLFRTIADRFDPIEGSGFRPSVMVSKKNKNGKWSEREALVSGIDWSIKP
jgi:hypothetical protein